MIPQYPTLLGSMAFVFVVSTVQVLIPPKWITSHLVRPSEVRFVLNLVYNSMHWLLKRYIYLPYLCFWILNPPPSGSRWKITLARTIYQWCLTFALQLIILQPFVLLKALY